MCSQASQSHCLLHGLSPLRAFKAAQVSRRFSTVLLLLPLLLLTLHPPPPPPPLHHPSKTLPRSRQRSTPIWATSAPGWRLTSRSGQRACERQRREVEQEESRRWRRRRRGRRAEERRCCLLHQQLSTSMQRRLQ